MKKALLIALALPLAAMAVENKEVAVCAAEKDTVARLACFDQLADRHDLAPKTVVTPSAGKGKWTTATNTDPLTDQSVHLALLDADRGLGRFGETINLVVRCQANKTEMYINWQSFLGMDGATITHRIDKNKAVSSTWDVSTDHKSAFMRSPVTALKQMAEGESFIANVTPYGESPVTAVFDISGAREALKDIRQSCGW